MLRFCKKCDCETDRYKDGKCKPCTHNRNAEFRLSNPSYQSSWRDGNPGSLREWQQANRDKTRAYCAVWQAENIEQRRPKRRVYDATRRARARDSLSNLSTNIIERLLKLQRGKCACGCAQPLGDNYHLDHRMPLALGGTNTDDNMQLLRKLCNLQKGAKHPTEFMQARGFLL